MEEFLLYSAGAIRGHIGGVALADGPTTSVLASISNITSAAAIDYYAGNRKK